MSMNGDGDGFRRDSDDMNIDGDGDAAAVSDSSGNTKSHMFFGSSHVFTIPEFKQLVTSKCNNVCGTSTPPFPHRIAAGLGACHVNATPCYPQQRGRRSSRLVSSYSRLGI